MSSPSSLLICERVAYVFRFFHTRWETHSVEIVVGVSHQFHCDCRADGADSLDCSVHFEQLSSVSVCIESTTGVCVCFVVYFCWLSIFSSSVVCYTFDELLFAIFFVFVHFEHCVHLKFINSIHQTTSNLLTESKKHNKFQLFFFSFAFIPFLVSVSLWRKFTNQVNVCDWSANVPYLLE